MLEMTCHYSCGHNSLCVFMGRNFDLSCLNDALNSLSANLLVANLASTARASATSLTGAAAIGSPVIGEWSGCAVVIILAPCRVEISTHLGSRVDKRVFESAGFGNLTANSLGGKVRSLYILKVAT